MNYSWLYPFIGRLTRGVFVHLPALYFHCYSVYKRLSDSGKHSLIRRFVQRGDWVVDVGAHIGYYSCFLARLVGKEGRVFAFEASPENFSHLVRHTRKGESITCYNMAVGNSNGKARLYLSSVLNVDHRMFQVEAGKRTSIIVREVRLDDLLLDCGRKISFIKMDIQGAEFRAVAGMAKLLEKHRPIILTELWPWGLSQAGDSAEHLLQFLEEQNYAVSLIDEKKRILKPFSLQELEISENAYYDIFAQPRHPSLVFR